MSNFLAVATVTATLQRVLQSVIGTDVAGAKATMVRPDTPGHGVPEVGVNIFLYEITPNAVLRNLDLPTRNSDGQAGRRPAAAVDLHYLMSFYGKDNHLEPQRVLGSVVRHLHSRPLLTRQMIRDTVTDPAYSYLATSNLADAVDPVRFSPLSLSLEELSKLWSVFFQTPYVLSAAYRAAVVVLEEELTPIVPLPVRERQVFVVPFQHPLIENVDPQIVATGATLTITGQNLRGDVTKLKFGDTLVTPPSVNDRQISVALPGALQPGVRTVQVIHDFDFGTPNEPHRGFESNVAPFILQPSITTAPPLIAARGSTLTLAFSPPIGREQSVALLVGDDAIPLPTRLPTDPPAASSFGFDIPATFSTGKFLLRVRVDGAESPLEVDTNQLSPTYNQYIGPTVTIT
jgi:hypothetical protein